MKATLRPLMSRAWRDTEARLALQRIRLHFHAPPALQAS